MPTPLYISAKTVKILLIGALLVLTACGGAKIITDKQTGMSLVDGGLVTVLEQGGLVIVAKLIYEKPEHYSLLAQSMYKSSWKFRNSTSYFGEEKLRSEVVLRNLVPSSNASQVLHLDISRRHITAALQDQLVVRNISWNENFIEFKIPAGYVQSFMEKVALFDPTQKL